MAELVSSGKTAGRSRLKKMPVRIDLTAMVDLAFLLITFFILTTSLQKPKAMQVAMPVGPPGGDPESRTMTICLGKSNMALWYLGMPDKPLEAPRIVNYSKTGLREALINTSKKVFAATGKPLIVILKPSGHTIYTDFVAALDELSITGVPSYAIAKISPADIELLKQQRAW
ncbi:MAG: biopolymer transporter ExbD [Bacteroidetes bacterium]|nr:biopolymer transporter ExbD [Bacteroidota bacterium]